MSARLAQTVRLSFDRNSYCEYPWHATQVWNYNPGPRPRPGRGIAGDLLWPSAGIVKLITTRFLVSEQGIWQSVFDTYSVAGEQSLRDALAAGKGRRACNYVSGIWIQSPIPLWLPAEWAVRFPPISAKRKRAKTSAKGNDVITIVSSTNQHFTERPGELVRRLRTAGLEWWFNNSKRSSPEVRKDWIRGCFFKMAFAT